MLLWIQNRAKNGSHDQLSSSFSCIAAVRKPNTKPAGRHHAAIKVYRQPRCSQDRTKTSPKPHRELTGLTNKINSDTHLCWNCCPGFRTQTLLACSIHHRSESCSDLKAQPSCSGLDAPALTPSRLLRSTCPRYSDDILTRRARHSAPCGRLHTQTSILRPPNSCCHCQTCPDL